jgi:hypothetical protein
LYLSPYPSPDYQYPAGRWYADSAWGRQRLKQGIPDDAELIAYLKPKWRWIEALQNDFAARADWCVKGFEDANHCPVVKVDGELTREVQPGQAVELTATATDPDGGVLTFRWWQYHEADSADSKVEIQNARKQDASFVVPNEPGRQVHIILEVTDGGAPPLLSYQRVICTIDQ